eukprot:s1426_g23.t1
MPMSGNWRPLLCLPSPVFRADAMAAVASSLGLVSEYAPVRRQDQPLQGQAGMSLVHRVRHFPRLPDLFRGTKAHPDYFDNVASSNFECCDQLCSSVACDKGYGECCKPLCSKHVCMGSWATDPTKKNQAGSSNEECCTPSCAALTCDSSKGYKYRLERHDRAQPAKNPEDFCCETTCAFFKDQCGRGQGMDEADEVKMKQSATATDFRGKCCEPVCSGVMGGQGSGFGKMRCMWM